MRLKSIDYSEFSGSNREWILKGLSLGALNLVVGKNASGKTRTLTLIQGLSRLLCNELKPAALASGSFDAEFEHSGHCYLYHIVIRDGCVIEERLSLDGDIKLDRRGEDGSGKIFADGLNLWMDFQTPKNDLAAVARRDTIQHSFLEPLHEWGKSLHFYSFGGSLGRDHLALMLPLDGFPFDPRDSNAVVGVLRRGLASYSEKFKSTILQDMKTLGYELSDVFIREMPGVQIHGAPIHGAPMGLAPTPVCLCVRETGIGAEIEQRMMSQGMFRALSIVIHVVYAKTALAPSCVVIDDIGEGLDFERSCALIRLLVEKVKDTEIQLIMSTNDRFVMNQVPLEAWSVLKRSGGVCKVYNFENSKDVFEEFQYTGLTNFDFFASDYLEVEVEELP